MSEGASTVRTVLALDADDARVERARAALAGAEGAPYRLSLSVGAATYDPNGPSDLAELIREADGRMRERAAGSGST